MAKAKVGLVLGGGGARGLAHIGIIKRLNAYGIPIDIITGASMGAIIGAAYAQTKNINYIESTFRSYITGSEYQSLKTRAFNFNKAEEPESFLHYISKIVKRRIVINLAANRTSLIQDKFLKSALAQLLNHEKIEETQIPFACTALDLVSGREIVFRAGDLLKAVQASASIPGFLPPVDESGKRLVDGAVIDNFPIKTTREMGAEFIIVCDVSPELEYNPPLNNVVDIFIRAHHAAVHRLNILTRQEADMVLKPEIGSINWTEFEQIDTLIKKGEAIVDKHIVAIKKRYARMNWPWKKIRRRMQQW